MSEMQVHVDIGARIKEAREAAGLTQHQLAQRVEQADRTVQAWEGNDRVPRIDALKRLALALDRPITYFYGDGKEAA